MRSKNTEISYFYLPKSVFSEADNQDLYIIGNSRSQHSLSEQAIESDCIGLQNEEENGNKLWLLSKQLWPLLGLVALLALVRLFRVMKEKVTLFITLPVMNEKVRCLAKKLINTYQCYKSLA